MIKNKRGSALVWAVVVIMILAVIVAAGLTVVQHNYNNSTRTASKIQAELAAKSALDSLIYAIETGENNKELISSTSDITDGKNIKSVEIELPGNMGTVESAYTALKSETNTETNVTNEYLEVGVSTIYNKQTASLKATMYQKGNNWKLDFYEGDENVK